MKTGMTGMKSAQPTRASALAQWAAVLGMGLLSVQAQAYPRESLEATDREAALQELLDSSGDVGVPRCQQVALGPVADKAPPRIVKVECKEEVLVKFHEQPVADAASSTLDLMRIDLMRKRLPEALFSMIRKPFVEFSFDETGGGKGYYTAWYAERGELSLHDWIQAVIQRIQDAECQQVRDAELEKLSDVYNQIGRFLGAAHRAGLINAGERFELLESQSVAQGLDGFSVSVTPAGDVVVDLDALMTDGKTDRPFRAMMTQLETLASELLDPLDSLPLDDFFATLASIGYSLPLAYCTALDPKPEAEVIAGSCFAALGPLQDDSDDEGVDASR